MWNGYRGFILCLVIGCLLFITLDLIIVTESASAYRMIDIRDYNGNVTTWGWWLVNIFAPFFITFELIKIVVGIICLPLALFGMEFGFDLLAGAWSNITVMWPGLLIWGLGSIK
ncbi:hypothetical protein [Anabaenopsis elenkinii]|uniref:Uncharacterized protein n=1 Tax=Anabaenopsis elenkinii CCIBt3563 TaxID=2779889 RepID=A0A7U3NLL5_9CYAN|nr:hypothetical protein [Anabaenopsis elenkinii]QOV21136.1 hypothetical protein IM676_10010 [Anabaenopsis elenkinii CCIBt3563]